MQFYKAKAGKLPGTNYQEVWKQARAVFDPIKKRTKRKPYVRSAYFNKEKIFFDFFWVHIAQKVRPERQRRLKFLVLRYLEWVRLVTDGSPKSRLPFTR